jgi:hypothetical protein
MESKWAIDPPILTGGSWPDLVQQCADDDGVYRPTSEAGHVAYQRARIWDILPGEVTAEIRRSQLQARRDIPEPKGSSIVTTLAGEELLFAEEDDKMVGRIISGTTASKLMILDNGYVGICHLSCLPGDEIWLVAGSDVPYVLRRLATGTHMFKGETYVHGTMDGEFLVKNFKSSDPRSSDVDDQSWLDSLENGTPFPTQEIILT